MFPNEVAVVKFHHGISVKRSRYRDTWPTNPSLVSTVSQDIDSLECLGQCPERYCTVHTVPDMALTRVRLTQVTRKQTCGGTLELHDLSLHCTKTIHFTVKQAISDQMNWSRI